MFVRLAVIYCRLIESVTQHFTQLISIFQKVPLVKKTFVGLMKEYKCRM